MIALVIAAASRCKRLHTIWVSLGQKQNHSMKAIIILGAAVWPDGPSPPLVRRVAHAVACHAASPADLVVPCGGLGLHPPAEARVMRDMLMAHGVPAARIVEENRSTTTFENIAFATAILRDHGVTEVLVVSDRYHGPRALMVARALGLSARFSGPPTPRPLTARYARALTRETFAIIGYRLRLKRLLRRFHHAD